MFIKLFLSLAVLAGATAVLIHRYYLNLPLPDGIEDPDPLQAVVATYNFVFYTAAAFWTAGATKQVFEPVKVLAGILRRGNAAQEFPGIDSSTELVSRLDGSQLSMKIDMPLKRPADPSPCVIYLHGGGYTLNSPAVYHVITGNLSSSLNIPVFTPDYRKSPQWIHPAQLDDGLTTLRHVRANAARYNIDPARIALVGDSAGAHLSISTTLSLLSKNESSPAALVLIYPATQILTTCLPSQIENRLSAFLSSSMAEAFRLSYLVGDTADLPALKASNHSSHVLRAAYAQRFRLPLLANPCPGQPENSPGLDWAIERYRFAYEDWLLSPLFAPQELLARFPPSLLQTCQFDVLRDEGRMFHVRLKRAGAAVAEQKNYASVHGMATFHRAGHKPAVAAIGDAIVFLRKSLFN